MAKFYSILQTGVGTLGNQYLRRTRSASGKEINVLANKNFAPKNPRTIPQMVQRAKFANAVKFYRRATKNFFRFAYEDKKANESDYNAFMRHNIFRAVPMVKAQSDNSAYPAMGKYFQLTEGTLSPLAQKWDDTRYAFGANAAITSVPKTVGEMSAQLIAMGYKAGQIFTFVLVTSSLKATDFSLLDADAIGAITDAPVWNISQFFINAEDTTPLSDVGSVGTNYLNSLALDTINEVPNYAVSVDANVIAAAAAIITEKVTNTSDLLCSTNYLYGNNIYDSILEIIAQDNYYNQMLASWGADLSTAILKGGLSGEGNVIATAPVVTAVNGVAVPANLGNVLVTQLTITGSNFDSESEITENSFTLNNGTIQSFALQSATQGKLTVEVSEDVQATLYYEGKQIATWYQGEKA